MVEDNDSLTDYFRCRSLFVSFSYLVYVRRHCMDGPSITCLFVGIKCQILIKTKTQTQSETPTANKQLETPTANNDSR